MRDFFIRSLETVIGIIVVLGAIFIVVAAVAISFGSRMGGETGGQMAGGGPLMGLFVLIAGAVYLVLVGGFMVCAVPAPLRYCLRAGFRELSG